MYVGKTAQITYMCVVFVRLDDSIWGVEQRLRANNVFSVAKRTVHEKVCIYTMCI